jgi:membrane protease YdiL (CAAX protease family)
VLEPEQREPSWRPQGEEPDNAYPVPWTWADALVVLVLTYAVALLFLADPEGPPLPLLARIVGESLAAPVSLLFLVALLGLVTALYVALRYPRRLPMLLGPLPPRWRALGAAVGFALAAIAVQAALVQLLTLVSTRMGGDIPSVQETFQSAARDRATLPFLALSAVVFAPLGEELFFRGLLFQALRRRLGLWPGIGISAVAFTLVHTQATLEGTGLVFLVIFPLGMLLAWTFHRYGTLLTPVALHAVFNLAGVVALALGLG